MGHSQERQQRATGGQQPADFRGLKHGWRASIARSPRRCHHRHSNEGTNMRQIMRPTILTLLAAGGLTVLPAATDPGNYQRAAASVEARARAGTAAPKRARNVILFIGDGMGISTITAARILEGQQQGRSGEENHLSFEDFPQTALVRTYS